MIRPEALTRLRLLAGTTHAAPVAGESGLELPPLAPGQPVDGRVDRQAAAGHIVSVDGHSFEIRLPEGTHAGDVLHMVYVGGNPRPTFALLGIERDAGHGDATLSEAGKLLAALRDAAVDAAGETTAQTAPLFEGGLPDSAEEMAARLRESLALSGLFYESHQAQWVLGTRTTAQLRREPQGKLAPLPPGDAPEEPVRHEAGTPSAPAQTAAAAADDAAPALPAHPETHGLIRRQLDALESGHIEWRGLAWPGQPMQWRVKEAPADAGGSRDQAFGNDPASRDWVTELRMTLPRLGAIVARIELGRPGVRLRLAADSPEQAGILRGAAPDLAARLAAAGVRVAALEVDRDGAAA